MASNRTQTPIGVAIEAPVEDAKTQLFSDLENQKYVPGPRYRDGCYHFVHEETLDVKSFTIRGYHPTNSPFRGRVVLDHFLKRDQIHPTYWTWFAEERPYDANAVSLRPHQRPDEIYTIKGLAEDSKALCYFVDELSRRRVFGLKSLIRKSQAEEETSPKAWIEITEPQEWLDGVLHAHFETPEERLQKRELERKQEEDRQARISDSITRYLNGKGCWNPDTRLFKFDQPTDWALLDDPQLLRLLFQQQIFPPMFCEQLGRGPRWRLSGGHWTDEKERLKFIEDYLSSCETYEDRLLRAYLCPEIAVEPIVFEFNRPSDCWELPYDYGMFMTKIECWPPEVAETVELEIAGQRYSFSTGEISRGMCLYRGNMNFHGIRLFAKHNPLPSSTQGSPITPDDENSPHGEDRCQVEKQRSPYVAVHYRYHPLADFLARTLRPKSEAYALGDHAKVKIVNGFGGIYSH